MGECCVGLEAVRDAEVERLPSPSGRDEEVHRSREDIQYGTLAVIPIVEIDGYIQRNASGSPEHASSLLDRVVIPDPDLRPQGGGVDRDVVPITGDEHERREHERIFFIFGGENAHSEDGREELEWEAVDRGGTLGSDGLFEPGFDFFAFRAEICHLRFEEAEGLPEMGDGEVCHRVRICYICVARDKVVWTVEDGNFWDGDRPLPQLYTCMVSKEKVCSIVAGFGGAESTERKLREGRGWTWSMATQVIAQKLCY